MEEMVALFLPFFYVCFVHLQAEAPEKECITNK
jgi:hypothetical protein